jgi:protein TonB
MTVQQPNNPGDLVAIRADRGSVANLQGVAAVVPRDGLADGSASAAADLRAFDLGNVIAFARARRADSSVPPVTIGPQGRPVPRLPHGRPWLQGALILCSLIIHGGVFYVFWQEPRPLQGIGIEAITVEIEIGDNRPAGPATSAGSNQVESRQVDDVRPDEKAVEEKRPTNVREVKTEEARTDITKEQPVEQPKELKTELQTEPQPQQQPEQQQVVAMVETPQAEIPTVLPRESPPDAPATLAVRRAQPKVARPAEPKQKVARPSEAKVAAGGSGRTVVASLANYNGLVSAHLRRYQQYPAAARSSGAAGSGMVTFSITASGSVTSARIAKGTGAAVLDQEILAMVRRASPFPAPPDGQPKSFTVPLHFSLQQ